MQRPPWRTDHDHTDDDADHLARARAARGAAILWLVLLIAHVVLIVVALVRLDLTSGGWVGHGFGWATIILAVALVGGTWGRGEVFKRYWVRDAVTPRGYILGHLVAWLPLLVASGVALGLCIYHAALWPGAIVMLLALFAHALMWPRAGALDPDAPA